MRLPRCVVALVVLLAAAAGGSTVQERPFVVQSDDRAEILLDRFGFLEQGTLSLRLTDLVIESSAEDAASTALLGLYIRRTNSKAESIIESESFCVQEDPRRVEADERRPGWFFPLGPSNVSVSVDAVVRGDEEAFWTSSIVNCRPNTRVSFTVRADDGRSTAR